MARRLGHLRALAVAALAIPLAVPTAARASDTEIVVEGSRSAYADIEVREDIFLNDVRFTVTSRGSFAGMIFEPVVRSSETAHMASLIAFRAPGLGSGPVSSTSKGWIPPGAYRVWILGDRPTKVIIPVTDGGFVVRPAKPVRIRLHARAATPVLSGRSRVDHRFDRALPAGWRALFGYHVTGRRAERTYLCATESDSCPARSSQLAGLPDLPSTSEGPDLGLARPSRQHRHLLAGIDGYRLTDGAFASAALVFTET